MKRWIVAAAFLVAASIAMVACGDSNGGGPSFGEGGPCPDRTQVSAQDTADMSVEELTDLVAEALTCPGYAFHMRSAGDTESGPYSSYSETEVWINLQGAVGRAERLFRITSDEALAEAATAEAEEAEGGEEAFDLEFRGTSIVRSDGRYSSAQGDEPAGKGRSPGCHGRGREVLFLVLGCFDGPLQYFEISIDPSGSYKDQDAIAYVAIGESSGSDETYYTTNRAYFAVDTFLPIGATVEGTLDIGEVHPLHSDIPFEYEFVPLDSLPEDFFDPASIGYVEPDPAEVEEPLDDAEIEVYWLGREFAGSEEYPALTLNSVRARPRSRTGEGMYIADLEYRPADDEFGYNWVSIGLYTPEAFEFREEHTPDSPCEEIIDLDIIGFVATFERYRTRDRSGACVSPESFSGVVRFDNVVVDIDAVTTNSGRESFGSPYDSEEAMELLIRSLELRE